MMTTSSIHNKNNKYKWGGVTALGRDHASRKGDYHDNWNTLVEGTNTERLCGAGDWRVPTTDELISVMNYSGPRPLIDVDYFPNTVSHFYWSSSPHANDDNQKAWNVDFSNGHVNYFFERYFSFRVRLVRGGQ